METYKKTALTIPVNCCPGRLSRSTLILFLAYFTIVCNACKKEDNSLKYGSMTDQDGNTYKTIAIGTQTWMAENLRTTTYRNGEPIANITDNAAWETINNGAYCTLENTTDNAIITTYGMLYNWRAVTDSRNIAPAGWHMPSDDEWATLITYLGGEIEAGGKMKEAGTAHWSSMNIDATNKSGFTAVPSSYRNIDGSFGYFGVGCYLWSNTQSSTYSAFNINLKSYNGRCIRNIFLIELGLSVRLVKD